jgi:hypothetical protein
VAHSLSRQYTEFLDPETLRRVLDNIGATYTVRLRYEAGLEIADDAALHH